MTTVAVETRKKDKGFEIAIISYPNLIEFDRKSICEDMLVFFLNIFSK